MDNETSDCVDSIVNLIRREYYNFFTNNCLHKNRRFKRLCKEKGIAVRLVLNYGIQPLRNHNISYPLLHVNAHIGDKKYEVTHTYEYVGLFGFNGHDFKVLKELWSL